VRGPRDQLFEQDALGLTVEGLSFLLLSLQSIETSLVSEDLEE